MVKVTSTVLRGACELVTVLWGGNTPCLPDYMSLVASNIKMFYDKRNFSGGKMENCENCKKTFHESDLKKYNSKMLCEDCYIDELMPKMPKAHYNNDAEFMNRLKDSFSIHPQQFH